MGGGGQVFPATMLTPPVNYSIHSRPRNKSGRYTGHHDRCIIKFAGQDGCFAGHLLIFLFAPILRWLPRVF